MELPLHCSQLLRDLNAQRESGLFCDCQVLVRGQRFTAHRNVLSACSVYFRTFFLTSLPEPLAKLRDDTGVATATLDHLAPSTFAVILDFMYTARLTLTSLNSEDVMSAAGFLQLTELVRACKDFTGDGLPGPSAAAGAAQPSSRKAGARKGDGQLGFPQHISLKRASPLGTSARRKNPIPPLRNEQRCEMPNRACQDRFNAVLQTSHCNMIVIDVKEEHGSLAEPQIPAETSNGDSCSSAPCFEPELCGRAQGVLSVRRLNPSPLASARPDITGWRISQRNEGAACVPDDDTAFIIVTVPPEGIKEEPDNCSPSNAALLEGDEWTSMDDSIEHFSPGPFYNRSAPGFRGKKFRIGDPAQEAHVFLDPQDFAGSLQPDGSAIFTKCGGNDPWDTGEPGAPSPTGGSPICQPRGSSAWKQEANLTAADEKWDGAMALFLCKHCPVRFTAKENLVRHQRTVHAGQKLKFCEMCQRNFRDSTDLQRHRLSKHWWQGRDGMCPFCPERFRVSRDLLKHIHHRHRGLAAF